MSYEARRTKPIYESVKQTRQRNRKATNSSNTVSA